MMSINESRLHGLVVASPSHAERFRRYVVTKTYQSLTGPFAREGAAGLLISRDGGMATVLFEEASAHLVLTGFACSLALTMPVGHLAEANLRSEA